MASASQCRVRIPSLRLHKASGQAVVTVKGRDFYCGKHGTPEAEQAYRRVIAEVTAHGAEIVRHHGVTSASRRPMQTVGRSLLTVNELLLAYVEHAQIAYKPPSRELEPINVISREVRRFFGNTAATDFGPLSLKTIRQEWVDRDLCRKFINAKVGRVVRIWAWAVENELLPAEKWQALKAVAGLREGRTAARESRPVGGVSDQDFNATLPHLPEPVRALVQLLYFTGARPGELRGLRTCDIVRDCFPWQYNPSRHKNSHRGKKRLIFFGPRARAILEPFLNDKAPEEFLFSPQRAVAAMKNAARSSQRSEAQRKRAATAKRQNASRIRKQTTGRTKPRSSRLPGGMYPRNSLSNAVRRACLRHTIPAWNPKQLRHTCRTRLDEIAGQAASAAAVGKAYASPEAQATLGHAHWQMTNRYGDPAYGVAAATMEQHG
jgi:integrase